MDKAYIVTNEQQEREVLNDLERQGIKWVSGGEKPTEFTPKPIQFPYGLFTDDEGQLKWGNMRSLEDEEIVYDGRKEDNMSEKYGVSQEFMNSLNEWRENLSDFSMSENFVGPTAIDELDDIVDGWWNITDLSGEEQNNRLIAIIRWVNGEDVFEVEKPKKWVVRSKESDIDNDYTYVYVTNSGLQEASYNKSIATKFNTKEEAQSWANSHQEVVEVDE